MDDSVDLILAQCAFQDFAVSHVSAHDFDLFDQTGADQFALRNPIADEADYVRAGLR